MPQGEVSDAADDLPYKEVEAAVLALAAAGERGAARDRLVGFIGDHPVCAEAHNDLGVLAYEAGDLPAAAEAIDRAIALCPNRARYHRNRALVLLTSGDLPAALAALVRALSLDPTDQETLTIVNDLGALRRGS